MITLALTTMSTPLPKEIQSVILEIATSVEDNDYWANLHENDLKFAAGCHLAGGTAVQIDAVDGVSNRFGFELYLIYLVATSIFRVR